MNKDDAKTYEDANNVFEFDKGDDLQFMRTVWRFHTYNKLAGTTISLRVYKMMVPFNDPANPATAAMKAKNHLVDCLRRLKLEEKDLDSTIFGLDKEQKITGNGAFANSFKIFYTCMELGGDLNTYV